MNVGQVARVDAADGEPGERDFGRDLANKLQPRERLERLRAARKGRADSEIVRAVEHRLPRLFDGVSRDADQTLRPDDPPCVANGQFVLTNVNTIGFGQHGDVRTIVHDQQCVRLASPLAQPPRVFDEFAVGQRLLTHLHDLHARRQRRAHDRFATGHARRSCHQQIQPLIEQPLARELRPQHSLLRRVEPVAQLLDAPCEGSRIGVDQLPELFERSQCLLHALERRASHIDRRTALIFRGRADRRPHVSQRVSRGEATRFRQGRQRGGQFVSALLQ